MIKSVLSFSYPCSVRMWIRVYVFVQRNTLFRFYISIKDYYSLLVKIICLNNGRD